MGPEEFFDGEPLSYQLYCAIVRQVQAIGESTIRVTKSQVAFRRQRSFAWVWIPGRVLKGKTPPLVLTLSFRERDPSPRWKQVVEPYPGRFTHHLELGDLREIDDEVATWLRKAWETAA
jgi:hypothetical protein